MADRFAPLLVKKRQALTLPTQKTSRDASYSQQCQCAWLWHGSGSDGLVGNRVPSELGNLWPKFNKSSILNDWRRSSLAKANPAIMRKTILRRKTQGHQSRSIGCQNPAPVFNVLQKMFPKRGQRGPEIGRAHV